MIRLSCPSRQRRSQALSIPLRAAARTCAGLRGRARSGLTLLEILLASAILAAALSVLAQQNSVGVQAALRSQLETEAAVHCQSLLNRLLAEGVPETDLPEQAISPRSRWKWSAKVESSEFEDLSLLSVTVYQDGPSRRISTFRLSRLVPGPRQKAER